IAGPSSAPDALTLRERPTKGNIVPFTKHSIARDSPVQGWWEMFKASQFVRPTGCSSTPAAWKRIGQSLSSRAFARTGSAHQMGRQQDFPRDKRGAGHRTDGLEPGNRPFKGGGNTLIYLEAR